MTSSIVFASLLAPPILFFFLGLLAVALRADLEIPQPIPKALSLYLLLSIGFRGGVELHKGGVSATTLTTIGACLLAAVLVPCVAFFVLRKRVGVPDAAALASAYGSVSAVTFLAAASYLTDLGLRPSGHMVAAMALMESPAIFVGIALARRYGGGTEGGRSGGVVREALLNGSVFLLLGSLLVGAVSGEAGERTLAPFVHDIFKGMLCLFLLDVGLVSGKRLGAVRKAGSFLLAFAVVMPLASAAFGITMATLLRLPIADGLLLTVLCAGASYIAVPAAVRAAIPDANPGIYVSLPLAVTFPFNVVVGIPLYTAVLRALTRSP